ncbi:hypothetical protein [Treponema sp.]|uniref:hypothetical protein n=1 Tax=Treponema sp. TaxID=166 RepID=UPI003F0CDBEE
MKTTTKLNFLRGGATIFFGAVIFLCGFFPGLNMQMPAAVFSGCILGSVRGAGSAGLCILAEYALGEFSIEATGKFAALFAGSLVSGLVAGSPSIEKKIKAKNLCRIFAGTIAGFAVFYLTEFFTGSLTKEVYIPADVLKCISLSILSAALRPKAAKILFPPEKAEKELEELVDKLKSKYETKTKISIE